MTASPLVFEIWSPAAVSLATAFLIAILQPLTDGTVSERCYRSHLIRSEFQTESMLSIYYNLTLNTWQNLSELQ